jgi:hypothetical protein
MIDRASAGKPPRSSAFIQAESALPSKFFPISPGEIGRANLFTKVAFSEKVVYDESNMSGFRIR